MTGQRRAIWGGLALLAALALALAPPPPQDTVDAVGAKPAARPPTPAGAGVRQAPSTLPPVARILPRADDVDAALPRLWPAAPVVAPVAAAPSSRAPVPLALPAPAAAPAAPPLAYRFVGRYADAQRLGVILQGPDGQVAVAHVGETLGSDYRVETIVGNSMVLRYLPLDLPQTLDIGVTR